MSVPVYSTRIYAGPVPLNADKLVALCPSGFRLVVKEISVVSSAEAESSVYLWLDITGTFIVRVSAASPTFATHTECSFVVHEGEQLLARPEGVEPSIYVGGYLLEGAGGPVTRTLPRGDLHVQR